MSVTTAPVVIANECVMCWQGHHLACIFRHLTRIGCWCCASYHCDTPRR